MARGFFSDVFHLDGVCLGISRVDRDFFFSLCWRCGFTILALSLVCSPVALREPFDTPTAVNLHDDYDRTT
jgi:hypothetical protein